MAEIKNIMRLVYQGKYDEMKKFLEDLPKETRFFIEDEPYCNLQKKIVCKTFKLVINDPRFVFDDLFVARQFYFSSGESREIVMEHPMFAKVVLARKSFMEYFYERYGVNGGVTHIGMCQRYIHAERSIYFWKERRNKKNQFRILFLLYPALVKYSREFRGRYYAPHAPGYLKANENFERHKHM